MTHDQMGEVAFEGLKHSKPDIEVRIYHVFFHSRGRLCGTGPQLQKSSHRLPYRPVSEARNSIGRYLDFCNGRRPHSSLDDTTPDHVYFTQLPLRLAA